MRVFLDKLYFLSALLAGIFIVFIALLILTQVIGRWFGIIIPSTEDFSGYFLATSSFLALAYTFQQKKHIRITLLLHSFKPHLRQKIEICSLIFVSLVVGYLFYYASTLVFFSWKFKEISQGYIPIPLYLAQMGLPIGLLIFLISIFDCLLHSFKTEALSKK